MSLSYTNSISGASSVNNYFNKFLNDSLTTYTDDRITELSDFFLRSRANVESLFFPNVVKLDSNTLRECPNLKTLLIRSNYRTNAMRSILPKLTHIILNDDNIVSPYLPLQPSSTRNSSDLFSPIIFNIGGFYVPQALLNDYKNATNWSAYADIIYSIENDYNPSVIKFNDTITDTWSEIASSENDNSYLIKYQIGDTKTIAINGTYCKMQIIDFNKDIIANDNEDKAKITWMSKYVFNGYYGSPFDPTSSSLDTFYNTIEDSTLKSLIKTVKKPTLYKNNQQGRPSVQTYNLKLWQLSGAELGVEDYKDIEQVDAYSIFTDDNASRILPTVYLGNVNFESYRTRSSASNNYFLVINNKGEPISDTNNYSRVTPFGFCT